VIKFKFQYAYWPGATVTVKAKDLPAAKIKAREEMDRRYRKLDREPPVAWTLVLME
jgi:hypothetical protein